MLSFKVCTPMVEDNTCANQFAVDISIWDHVHIFDKIALCGFNFMEEEGVAAYELDLAKVMQELEKWFNYLYYSKEIDINYLFLIF